MWNKLGKFKPLFPALKKFNLLPRPSRKNPTRHYKCLKDLALPILAQSMVRWVERMATIKHFVRNDIESNSIEKLGYNIGHHSTPRYFRFKFASLYRSL